MNLDQIKNQIQALLKIAKISDEEKKNLLGKLPASTQDQLEALKTNLMQQVTVDVYFDMIEEFEEDDHLLDESDLDELVNKIIKRLDDTQAVVFTDAELASIRQNLQDIQQKVASTAVKTQPQAPQQAPVQTPMAPKPVTPPTLPAA